MKFYTDTLGNELVIHGNKELVFKDGVFETEDKGEIEVLKKYYRYDEVEEVADELTKADIMELLDEKGIEYNKRATKPELLELLGE